MDRNLPKVVVVGFNKCATRSLASLFKGSGHRAVHHKLRNAFGGSRNVARLMRENLEAGRPVFHGFDDFTLYSDLVYVTETSVFEGNAVFRNVLADYPGTVLLLNLRDRDRWLQSRLRHGHGEFARRYMKAANCADHEELLALWAKTWDEHISSVREFAAARDVRLIEFDIEKEAPERLAEALPEFDLKVECWSDTGRSRGRKHIPLVFWFRRTWAHIRPRSFR